MDDIATICPRFLSNIEGSNSLLIYKVFYCYLKFISERNREFNLSIYSVFYNEISSDIENKLNTSYMYYKIELLIITLLYKLLSLLVQLSNNSVLNLNVFSNLKICFSKMFRYSNVILIKMKGKIKIDGNITQRHIILFIDMMVVVLSSRYHYIVQC